MDYSDSLGSFDFSLHMSFIAHQALSVNAYLGPFGRAIAAVEGAPEDQLAAIFNWLGRVWDCRWPTSLVVMLLLRLDQLADVGAVLDIEAILDVVDFSLVQPAEHRALYRLAASCSRRTSALCVILQKVAILEPSTFGDSSQSLASIIAADDRYGPARPGDFVAGNLDTGELDNLYGDCACLEDLAAENNKLYSGPQNAPAAAQLLVYNINEGDDEEEDDDVEYTWGAYVKPADGKSLHDAGVRSFVTYSIPPDIGSGILLAMDDKCSEELSKRQSRWHGNHSLDAWLGQLDEEQSKVLVGVFLCG